MLTAEQKAIRATGIGGSEIGILAGLSRWASPIDIYERKLGLRPDETSHHLERGTFLEPAIIRWYEARKDMATRPAGTLRHPTLARVIATPDALVLRTIDEIDRVLEVKAPNHRTWSEWGEPGSDAIPASYIAQVQWEMACAEVHVADVAAIIDGDLAIYTVPFDAELFGELAEIAHKFWRDHVEKRVPPPPDGSQSYAESLARRFPSTNGIVRLATPEECAIAEQLRHAREEAARAIATEERLRQELVQRIGEAGGIAGDGFRITYNAVKGRSSIDTKALAAAHPSIAEQFTKQGKPYRRFMPTWSE